MSPSSRTRNWFSRKRSRPYVVRLEDRTQPSIGYLPPSQFIVNESFSAVDNRLTSQSSLNTALDFLNLHAAKFDLGQADLVDPFITSQYTDADTGIGHLYLRQKVNGLQVADADFSIGIAANGAVFSAGGGFVRDLSSKLAESRSATPVISPLDAVRHAATGLGLSARKEPVLVNPILGPTRSFVINAPTVSQDDITAQLHYVPTEDGSAVLAWELIILTPDGQHWYDLSVDATDGTLVRLCDWMSDASYHGLPLPHESPQDGGFAVVNNPAYLTASPFGWHDTNGVAGAEFTDTRGNNVDAHLDRNADNSADISPPRPAGGPGLNFDSYLFYSNQVPTTLDNENAAVVNLFAMNNVLHDVHYQYGFTEVAGNFQVNNYGKGGSGNDAVQADAQDGSGLNNANFGTPTDGKAPRMQMYIWTAASPDRDSDLDNGIIAHEYGHGVSNRLTGGPGNSSALNATQSGGMGEGWSDFHAMMLSQRQTDTQNGSYGMGTYSLNEPLTGDGIRRFPYSYDMAVNPLTFDAYGDSGTTPYGVTRSTQVHNSGELWCSALLDMNWLLINKYGYDANLHTGWTAAAGPGHAGNKLTLRLVMEAMKLQPANPSFIQARDAIIAADIALNGGIDLFEIWSAFARRGLGANASTPDSSSKSPLTIDTSLPMLVASVVPATGAVVTSHPVTYTVNVSDPIDPLTLEAGDFTVNGKAATAVIYSPGAKSAAFTFAIDPVTGEGAQSVFIDNAAFTRASDGSPVGGNPIGGSLVGAKFTSDFYFDPTPLAVTSITPTPGSTLIAPLTTIDVNLNGAVNPSSVTNGDLSLTQGTVTGFTLLNADTTVRFTLANLTSESKLFASVAAGAFTDANGSPNAAFAGGSYLIDFGTVPFPTPLVQRHLPGSLIYDGSSFAHTQFAGDADTFTLNLDPGQLLSVVVTSTGSLWPSLTITGPGTNSTKAAPAVGGVAQLQQLPISVGGAYEFKVSGLASTTGEFKIDVSLNLGTEAESIGGATNNTIATAQNLGPLFLDLGTGVARASLLGRTDSSALVETEPNDTTANANVVTAASEAPTDYFHLSLSGELGGQDNQDYYDIGQLQVGDVITISESGLYSDRGTLNDAFVYLYRGGAPGGPLISDDDSGSAPPGDALIHRYTITTTDTYFIRASRFDTTNSGTFEVGVLLQNVGAGPLTGGNFVAEGTDPNGLITTAEDASTSWRAVNYVSTTSGTVVAGDTDLFRYTFNAGDRVSLVVNSSLTLDPQTALLDSTGTVLALDGGTGTFAVPGGFASIFGHIVATTGDYYLRVTGAGGSTGAYTADLYASSSPTPPTLPPGVDLYSFTLAAGQSATATLNNIDLGNLDIALLDTGGAVLVSGVAGSTSVDEIAANMVAPTPGTYFVRVTGPGGVNYQLTVVTGGTMDAEANDTFASAQLMGASRAALGIINGSDDWYQFAVNAGDTITLTTSTPGGGPGEFVNVLNPAIELYSPGNVLVGSDDNSGPDGKNAILTKVASATGNYRVRVIGAGGSSGEYVVAASINSTPPPKVASVVIGDGTVQRSRINSLTINFDQVVTLPATPANAFLLTNHDGDTVTLNVAVMNNPNTTATLTFTGNSVDFGSLADGRYTLTILSTMVTGAGGNLDGDGNGTGNDNFVLDSAIDPLPPTNIFRLFGDGNGDGQVTSADFADFRTFFGLPGPNSIYDFNNDNQTNSDDFAEFRQRFGLGI